MYIKGVKIKNYQYKNLLQKVDTERIYEQSTRSQKTAKKPPNEVFKLCVQCTNIIYCCKNMYNKFYKSTPLPTNLVRICNFLKILTAIKFQDDIKIIPSLYKPYLN